MMIVIEGVDGAGKSTASRALAIRLNANCLHPARNTNLLLNLKAFIDQDKNSVIPGFIYYSMLNQIAVDSVRNKISSNREVVIFDRFLYSVFAIQTTLDKLYNGSKNQRTLKKLKKIIFEDLPKPNAIVFLYVNSEERMKRILRKTPEENLIFDKNIKFGEKLQAEFMKLALDLKRKGLNTLEVDTTNLRQEVVLKKITDFWGNVKK